MIELLTVLFLLLVGHSVADFSLQIDTMAKGKNRHNKTIPPPGAKYVSCWPYWLTAHALTHGGAVYLVTGSVMLGFFETVAHWATDFCKCENWITVHEDQLIHVGCKVFITVVYLKYGGLV